MTTEEKIIIVENDIPIAAKLSLQLNRLGYNITGIFSRVKDALHFLEQEMPDLILLDDKLKGQLNGIESGHSKIGSTPSPIIYFNNSTAKTIEKLLPKSLLRKKDSLKKTIKKLQTAKSLEAFEQNEHCILKDRIFIKYRDKMIKISLNEIKYIEADRNYCKLFVKDRKYLLVTTLKEVDEKLTDNRFLRIHRSYIANIAHIDEVGGNHVIISEQSLPLSKNMRAKLFKYLQII